MYMRGSIKLSWTFPLLFIIVFLIMYLGVRYYKEGLTTASLANPRVVNTIRYNLGNEIGTMTASRVWSDPHGSEVWLWAEDASTDPNLVQLKAISPQHVGQTLTLDLAKNQYIWTVPGQAPTTFPIVQ
jgi:hypothetical protein